MTIRKRNIIVSLATVCILAIAFGVLFGAGRTGAQAVTCRVQQYSASTEAQVFSQATQHRIGNVVFYESKWTRDWATSQAMFDIDHHVSKAEAVALGLCDKSTEVQRQFAQDPLNLYATNPGLNRGKGNRSPEQIAAIQAVGSLVKTTLRDRDVATEYCAIRHAVMDKYELRKPETEFACVNWLTYGHAADPTPIPTTQTP